MLYIFSSIFFYFLDSLFLRVLFIPSKNLQKSVFQLQQYLQISPQNIINLFIMEQENKLKQMHELALSSRSRAYCPYSKFAVGSCVLAANGKYYTGCNVQKAVNSLCAEGTAIVKMVQDGCRQLKQVYVVTQLTGDQIAAPCGICRQYIKQFSHDDQKVMVHLGSVQKGHQLSIKFSTLLPYSFGPKSLGINFDK